MKTDDITTIIMTIILSSPIIAVLSDQTIIKIVGIVWGVLGWLIIIELQKDLKNEKEKKTK